MIEKMDKSRGIRRLADRVPAVLRDKRRKITDNRDERIIKLKLEDYVEGYPRTAAFVNGDSKNALFRRFAILRARSLLYKEAELTDLEEQLKILDEEDQGDWKVAHSIHVDDGDQNEVRRDLMIKINQRLKEYDDMLLRDRQARQLPKVSKTLYLEFFDYLYTENSLGRDDQRFVNHSDDFVSLSDYENSWIDGLLHRLMCHCRGGILRKIFVSHDDQIKTSDEHVNFYTEARMESFIKTLIAFISTTLLLTPMYLFLMVPMSTNVIACTVLIFIFLFSAAISTFTDARRPEVLAATAGYCAVLVVFVGNLQQFHFAHVSTSAATSATPFRS